MLLIELCRHLFYGHLENSCEWHIVLPDEVKLVCML